MRCLIALSLLLVGCYTPITKIDGIEKDEFLRTHFTEEAYQIAKDIPIVEGWIAPNPLAAGTNFWSRIASFFLGCGINRKIILTSDCLDNRAPEHVIHEYIHHFHDMTIDGDLWIDEDEFMTAYTICATDTKYAGVVIMTERYANHPITNIFGISERAEYISYAGARAHIQGGPDYLERVYRKFLKTEKKE